MEERQRRGRRRERMGLKNEFGDSRRVCSSFFMLLLSWRAAEGERRQRRRWRGGETASDGEIDMME